MPRKQLQKQFHATLGLTFSAAVHHHSAQLINNKRQHGQKYVHIFGRRLRSLEIMH